jgi:hypothetical protein
MSMTSSRQGGTKLLNCVDASGRETCARYARLTSKAKGDAPMKHVSPF